MAATWSRAPPGSHGTPASVTAGYGGTNRASSAASTEAAVGLVDEVDLEAHHVVQREAGGAKLVGEVLQGAGGLLGGRASAELAVHVQRKLRRDEHEVAGRDAGGRGAERSRRHRRSDR